MNLRNLAIVCYGLVGLTVTLTAQQAVTHSSKARAKVHAKTVTITGCVTQGVDADHYVLANAVREKAPPSSAATPAP